jgi:hypothetical protein
MEPVDVLICKHRFFGRFYNLYDPEEMKAGIKAGLFETCSTLVGEVAESLGCWSPVKRFERT